MKWYVWVFSLTVAFSGFLVGYEVGSINGVKEMAGYRKVLNISRENGTCTSSDDVETGALLGIVVIVLHIGSFIGALLAGILSDVAGRKAAVVVGATCCVVGSALQAGALNIWVLNIYMQDGVSRKNYFWTGNWSTPKHLRGRLASCTAVLTTIGLLLGNVMNALVINFLPSYDWGWRITLAVHGVAATALGLGGIIVPESPRWLSKKHRYSKALVVLRRIHEDETKALNELEKIKESLNTASKLRFVDTVKFLFHRRILKRVLLGFCLQFFGKFAGGPFFAYYSVTLFCGIGVDGFVATVALVGTALGCQLVSIALIDKAGRKPLLLFGALGLFVCSMVAATLVYVFKLKDLSEENNLSGSANVATYAVVVLVILCASLFNMSFGFVPSVMNSEIYPLHIRGITVAISTTGWWGGNIAVIQLFPVILTSALGAVGIFYLLAGVNVLLTIYVLLLIPETKGRSLEEIELLFKEPWHKRANILYYLSCACFLPQVCKSKCQNRIQRQLLPVKVVSDVSGEDSEQLLDLKSLDGIDSVLPTGHVDSQTVNGDIFDSETFL